MAEDKPEALKAIEAGEPAVYKRLKKSEPQPKLAN